MKNRLYYQDPFLKTFEAAVEAVKSEGKASGSGCPGPPFTRKGAVSRGTGAGWRALAPRIR